jgi:hypothetical protein
MKNNENNNETIMKIMKNVDKNNKQKPWTIMKTWKHNEKMKNKENNNEKR